MSEAKGSNVYSKTDAEVYLEADGGDLPSQIFHDEVLAAIARRKKVGVSVPKALREDAAPTTDLGLAGLAISGGGIRSATFGLGVMQALAKEDLLKHFDYMSTVSGGGYIGSCLTWALYGKPQTTDEDHLAFIKTLGVGPKSFPTGTDDPRCETPADADPKRERLLKFLREHGKYLTPGGGITSLSCLGILLRGILLNLLVWVAVVACLIYFTLEHVEYPWFESLEPALYLLLAGAALSVLYSVLTFFRFKGKHRYRFRRLCERLAPPYFVLLFLAIGFGTLGWVHGALEDWAAGLSPAMMLSGAASGLWTFSRTASQKPGQKSLIPIGVLATVAALLLLYGGFLGAYALADFWNGASGFSWSWLAATYDLPLLPAMTGHTLVPLGLLAFTLLTGWFVNINQISLHRFYRDRLMETFLPGIDRAIKGMTGASPEADAALLSEMWDSETPRGPYHIINTNLVTVDSNLRTQRTRGGENFILSPFYCGSTITGWRRTEEFENNAVTLATGMAVSAAAANPNAGVAGQGVSRNKFVSLLMALLNLRLGYWTHRPKRPRRKWFAPNHFWPGGAYELAGRFQENSIWLQLTDGGHFENLAIYELIRRRLKLIVVLDSGADPNFVFADLQNACRRIATDFGARIEFSNGGEEDDRRPESLLTYDPRTRDEERGMAPSEVARGGSSGFPSHFGTADRGWLHGTIHYAGGKEKGELIYIKTTMVDGLSLTTHGYKDANPTFPDQTTADQFFEPEQFAAYRELGYVIGADAAEKIRQLIPPPRGADGSQPAAS